MAVKLCPEWAQHLLWAEQPNEDFQQKYDGNTSLAFVRSGFRGGVEFVQCPGMFVLRKGGRQVAIIIFIGCL